MSQLSIRVGASVDRSLDVAYRPLVESAKRARAAIDAEGKKAARSAASAAKKQADDEAREYARAAKEIEKWQREKVRAAEKSARDTAKANERIAAEEVRAHERAEKEKTRATQREQAQRAREVERAMARAQRQEQRNDAAYLRRTGRAAVGISRAGISLVTDVAGSLARGAGVNTDLGSIFTKNTDLETLATNLSNQGFLDGDARNGRRVDPRALMAQALDVGKATGTTANSALDGLAQFVAKTGDLATGREILRDMAGIAKVTGTELDDMAAAAGDVAAALPDSAKKGEQVSAVMRAIAGQGKLGAVEIKDLATQMAKLAANAGQIEGDTSRNIALLGAFAQAARQQGGAASATQAATSAAALINTFKTPARAAAFRAATGKSVFTSDGMLRDPQELVMEALRAAGSNPEAFKKIFSNVQGARAVEGFATIYRQAGGGKAGEAAVTAKFDEYMKAAIKSPEESESFRASMATTQSKAEAFNATIQEQALRAQAALMPALADLAPAAARAATALADIADKWGQLTGKVKTPGEESAEKARGTVHNAITETNSQLAQGVITEGQRALNEQAETEARAALDRAKAERGKDLATRYSADEKALLKTIDYTPAGALLAWITGGKFGDGLGTAIVDTEKYQLGADKLRVDALEKSLDDIRATNRRLTTAIEGGLVIKSMPTPPGGPPRTPADGRQSTPEERATQR